MLERLTTVRHGEVYSNIKRVAPSEDEPLTELGLEQAIAVAKALKDYDFDIAYTSPSVRTVRTAEEIRRYHPETAFVQESCIRDPDLGEYAEESIDYIRDMMTSSPSFRPNGGESADDLDKRVCAFADDLLASKEKSVLVVSHNAPIMHLLGYLLNIPRERYEDHLQDNGAISVVEFTDEGAEMVLRNLTKHLEHLY